MASACREIARLSQPSLCFSQSDVKKVEQLVEVINVFFKHQCEEFVQARLASPIAEVLLQDVTPLRTSTVHSAGSGNGAHITRKGKQLREFMLQRLFLLDHLGAKRVLFSDPVEMEVKTAAAHYSAAVARTMGHDGILISHGCWDRAIYSAFSRLMAQRSLAFRLHQEYDNDHDDVDVHLRWLKLWCTSSGCSAHDFSNSLRWSSLNEPADRHMMRRMWIVVESLRSSLDQLVSSLGRWIGDSIQLGDYRRPLCFRSGVFWAYLSIGLASLQS